MRQTVREIMAGVTGATGVKKVAHNTVEYRNETGERIIRYHNTDIVRFCADGKIILNAGKWQTTTTKKYINMFSDAGIYQKNYVWYMRDGRAFENGITV